MNALTVPRFPFEEAVWKAANPSPGNINNSSRGGFEMPKTFCLSKVKRECLDNLQLILQFLYKSRCLNYGGFAFSASKNYINSSP